MNINDLSSALCDMYDVKRALRTEVLLSPKDNEGTETTIGECIDEVIEFLETLEENKNVYKK